MFALAAGALIGDVVVHIFPEAYATESTQSSFVALTFVCSIAFFMILERIFERCGITHEHWTPEEDQKNKIGQSEEDQQNGESKIPIEQSSNRKENNKQVIITDLEVENRMTKHPSQVELKND